MTKAVQKPENETRSEEETVARREAALKRMLATPHRPQADSKKGARTGRAPD